jgi:phage terminase large subunit
MSATIQSGLDRWVASQAGADWPSSASIPLDGFAAPQDGAPPRLILPYTPFPRQMEFHRSTAKYRLFGGAAGPGKSKALLMEAILQANERTGANTLLLRRTFPELESSLLLYFRRDVPRELYRAYNDTKHAVTWWNGSTTRFGYSKSENDIYQYQGSEYLFIGIDELTLFTLKQWQFLTSRNRCPVPGAFPNMAAASNPGNIGHAWVKSLWIDRQSAPGMERPGEYDAADYAFIPARVWDNPIYANDANYLKTLHALPMHLRRAFLDGDWDVFAGQYFSNFDPARHVERAERIGFAEWWPRWISMDWGFEHPAAVYWHAQAPGGHRRAGFQPVVSYGNPDDEIRGQSATAADGPCTVTYREFVRQHMSPRALAHEIVERSRGERITNIYLSPDAFAHRTDESSIAEQMGDVLAAAGLPRPVAADNDRVGGWLLMYQMLDAGEWIITENCAELIRTLPALVRDPVRVEDIDKMDGDDPADAARYGLKSRMRARPAANAPFDERVAARVTSSDPTIRAIQARKAEVDEQRRGSPVFFARHHFRPRGSN